MTRKTKRKQKKPPVKAAVVSLVKPVAKALLKPAVKPTPIVEVESEAIDEEVYVPKEAPKRTSSHMSHYEYCSLIAARVAQLNSRSLEWNAPKIPLEPTDSRDPLVIATKEVNLRLVSLVVRRKLPDGSVEDWLLKDMIFPRI